MAEEIFAYHQTSEVSEWSSDYGGFQKPRRSWPEKFLHIIRPPRFLSGHQTMGISKTSEVLAGEIFAYHQTSEVSERSSDYEDFENLGGLGRRSFCIASDLRGF
ncbi:hypothetical protein QUF80_15150 [Desulfococcaceae bacterium HSG8]|nr:hypothetical protein [Desulfococcaceae bacterium HSG8]